MMYILFMAKVLVSLPDIFVGTVDAYWVKYKYYSRSEFIREALRRYMRDLEGIPYNGPKKDARPSPYEKRARNNKPEDYFGIEEL